LKQAELVIPESCLPYLAWHRTGVHDYRQSVLDDFEAIESFLPERVESIIDIGCGMAAIDVLLKKEYPDASLRLLDGDGYAPVYEWNGTCEPYSSRSCADELLSANGVSHDGWIDVGTKEPLVADLIISLQSWGFHYPLSTYSVKGFCIADIRLKYENPHGMIIGVNGRAVRCAWEER
jgi:hypothetical protein